MILVNLLVPRGRQLLAEDVAKTAVYEVYKVQHRESGRTYFGFTGATTAERWRQHVRDSGRHQACRYLAHAIQAHGPEAFEVTVIQSGMFRRDAAELEERLIAEFKSLAWENGYNICRGGEGRTSTYCQSGRHLMAEVRKIKGECHPCWLERERIKRQNRTPEQREKENKAARDRRARNKQDPAKWAAQQAYSKRKHEEAKLKPDYEEKKQRWAASSIARAKERAKTDPEFRARRREAGRRWAARQRAKK